MGPIRRPCGSLQKVNKINNILKPFNLLINFPLTKMHCTILIDRDCNDKKDWVWVQCKPFNNAIASTEIRYMQLAKLAY